MRKGMENNVIEWLHDAIKERTEVMRGLDNDKTAENMMEANKLYYNLPRPRQALSGKTPAEKTGINLQLEGNTWEQLIRQAKRNLKVINEEKQVENP